MKYPWQDQQWRQLWQSVQSGRLPHALLLTGMVGTGKHAFALHTAQALLCASAAITGDPCGSCHTCRLVVTNVHPNLYQVIPEKEGHAIKVDQIRALSEFVQQTSLKGQLRIAVIYPAHSMNINAANALLKTLEEPAPDAILILVTDQPNHLPATVRSRCQCILFSRPDQTIALQWLRQQLPDDAQLEQWLRLAHGAPLQALRLTQEDVLPIRADVFQGLQRIAEKQSDPQAVVAKWQKLDPEQWMDLISGWVTDLIRLQLGGNSEHLLNQDVADGLVIASKHTVLNKNLQLLERLLTSRRQLSAGVNFNKQLLMESMLIHWMEPQS